MEISTTKLFSGIELTEEAKDLIQQYIDLAIFLSQPQKMINMLQIKETKYIKLEKFINDRE